MHHPEEFRDLAERQFSWQYISCVILHVCCRGRYVLFLYMRKSPAVQWCGSLRFKSWRSGRRSQFDCTQESTGEMIGSCLSPEVSFGCSVHTRGHVFVEHPGNEKQY